MAPSIPVDLTNEKIIKLKDHINGTFNAFTEDGELDLDKCQRNVAYCIGDVYTNYSGLLFQENLKLTTIEENLKYIKAVAYDEIKRNVLAYDVDAKGVSVILEGHEKVRVKQCEYDRQKAYVEFLERTVKQIGYYSNGVKTMLQREEIKLRYGA